MDEKNGLRMLTRFALEKERLEVRINTLSFDYYLSLSLSRLVVNYYQILSNSINGYTFI